MPAFLAEAQDLLGREYPEFDVVWFGHVGDGNLHINVLRPEGMGGAEFVAQCEQVTKLLAETLQRYRRSLSAEHGIGLVFKPFLSSPPSAAVLDVIRVIRLVLFPPTSDYHSSELHSLILISSPFFFFSILYFFFFL